MKENGKINMQFGVSYRVVRYLNRNCNGSLNWCSIILFNICRNDAFSVSSKCWLKFTQMICPHLQTESAYISSQLCYYIYVYKKTSPHPTRNGPLSLFQVGGEVLPQPSKSPLSLRKGIKGRASPSPTHPNLISYCTQTAL